VAAAELEGQMGDSHVLLACPADDQALRKLTVESPVRRCMNSSSSPDSQKITASFRQSGDDDRRMR